ncbi:xylose isomerase-like protein [Podospora australis]|uniref:Apurinic-apyrimidinic endonuclease 1 n=1 Tax=Podospora australis TaxID=1536484 RepID=A0AAN6WRM4_9PEZI|nr:xylose isomerase-like protein [Podospora australis]
MPRQSARQAAQSKKPTIKTEEEAVHVETKVVTAKVAKAGKSAATLVGSKVSINKRTVAKRKVDYAENDDDEDGGVENKRKKEDDEDEDNEEKAAAAKPAPKKRKTAAKKQAEDEIPLAARTAVTSLKKAMYIGAHVSGAGGVQNAVTNATHIGANAFALFLKSQRKWASPPLADENKTQWHELAKQHNYDAAKHVLPHGSYLVNLAQANKAKADQAYDNFVDDLQRCEALGISLYNFHPGSTGGETMESACARIASQLNKAHKATKTVVTLLENMCGSGNVVGSRFEELRDIIAGVEDKSRVGVCIDTCHAFAAGYDLHSPEAFKKTLEQFDEIVGLKYLKAFHLNDSKAPFGSHRDLHANIGTGFLGLRAFHNIMNHESLQNLPMVLETPIEEKGPDGKTVENKQIWADEIKLLESLIGMDAETDEFEGMATELQIKGASERQKIQEQVDKKAEKDAKKAAPKKGKKAATKKKKDEEEDSCDSCRESD